ncbi:hypothetical protein [Campylobacter helveticus]|uniref:hypothetical protein n=1 Tax=Campylobacter helveticus TaxID=28898 RepID=UPI0022EAB3CC|nr:hypothetical protein [Campylobacter helveticus]
MEQIVRDELIKVRTQALLQDFFKKYFKGSKEELEEFSKEAMQMTNIVIEDIKSINQHNVKELEDKATQNIRSELATRDFVEAKVNEAKLELKEEINHLKLYVIAAIILIVVLQPRVFDLLTSIFK